VTSPETLAAARPRPRSLQSVLTRRWARLAIPSVADLFFLALMIWLFLSGANGWKGLLADGDVGWHIRTGEYILDNHAVPRHDLFSWSKPGAPWYAWEWLTDVIDGSLHRVAGLKGVVLLAAVIIAAFATSLIRRIMWRGSHLFVALAISLLAVGSASMHFLARPHVFTLLLLSLTVWMIEGDREQASRRIWWLVPITIVWTNLHGGFLALVAVLGLTAAGTAIEILLSKTPQPADLRERFAPALRYAALTAACLAASLINPYGWHLHQHVFAYLRSEWIMNTIQEFKSPSFRNENMMQFEVLLLIGLIVAGVLFRRKRISEGLWVLFFAHNALQSVRHVPIFATVAAPLIAAEITAWWNQWTADAGQRSLAGIINQLGGDFARGFGRMSLWPAAAVVALMLIGAPIPWPTDFPEEMFPVKQVRAHPDLFLNARVLTTDQWADYLIYVNPAQKVFMDGRSDFYGPEIGNQLLHMVEGKPDWAQILEKHKFTVALLPAESALVQLLKTHPEWRVLDDDGKRVLLVLRSTSVLPTGNIRPEPRS
jgi:hypothetical protein